MPGQDNLVITAEISAADVRATREIGEEVVGHKSFNRTGEVAEDKRP